MVASVAPAASAIMTGAAQTSLKGEDLWKTHMQAIGGDMVSFAIVADGHGGVSAAQLCSERIVPYIIEEAHGDASASSLRKAGGAAFERVHKEVRAAGATDGVFPGPSGRRIPKVWSRSASRSETPSAMRMVSDIAEGV